MSLTMLGVLLLAMSGYSYMLIRKAGHVQRYALIPFLYQLHSKNVLKTLTPKEHELIHDQVDLFNLRILSCFIACVVGVGLASLFFVLVSAGGDGSIPGYIMAVLFAYLGANYNLNSTVTTWVRASESELMSRVMVKNAKADGFDNLSDYLKAENDKMISEAIEEAKVIADEYEDITNELGFDPDKDYNESDEAREELFRILDEATEILRQRHPKMDGKDRIRGKRHQNP